MWPYRLAIRTLVAGLQPMIVATTANGTPRSRSLVTVVCRLCRCRDSRHYLPSLTMSRPAMSGPFSQHEFAAVPT
jgi:hypothetical protein